MSEEFTMPRKLAHELLGALFNGPGTNPAGYEALKQDFAARMRASRAPAGRVAALEALHIAVVDHRDMFEGTSDEFNMSASTVTAALDLLHGSHCISPATPLDRPSITALIGRYTGLQKITAPEEFAELERLVYAVIEAEFPADLCGEMVKHIYGASATTPLTTGVQK